MTYARIRRDTAKIDAESGQPTPLADAISTGAIGKVRKRTL
jgi:hypothetical protein